MLWLSDLVGSRCNICNYRRVVFCLCFVVVLLAYVVVKNFVRSARSGCVSRLGVRVGWVSMKISLYLV
jgi:hypothetical protein